MKYRKRPVVVDAFVTDKPVDIETLEGTMHASAGDYIITGVNGEKYPCKPDIFNKTYELAEDSGTCADIKVLVVGRSGTGKDTLRECLEESYGFTFVKSHTTRKPRFEGEDTHVFVTKDQAKSVRDKVAVTYLSNNVVRESDVYYSTEREVLDCDAYIVDPLGVFQLLCNMPDTNFMIVYLGADDSDRAKVVKQRNRQKGLLGLANRLVRMNSENHEFGVFDTVVRHNINFRNLKGVIEWRNTYQPDNIAQLARQVVLTKSVLEHEYSS